MGSAQYLHPETFGMSPLSVPLESARWFAVHTRARHEKAVARQLQDKGITVFLPLLSQPRRWSDRRKTVHFPLFSGYAFVRIGPAIDLRLFVLRTLGVVRFVGGQGSGIPIPDKEIDDLRALLANHLEWALHPFVKIGRRVRILGGCLDGIEGVLMAQNRDRSLVVSIELIQRSVSVRIDGYDVEAI